MGPCSCRVLKVTYSGHIWRLKIKRLWKCISVAALCVGVCVLSKPSSRMEVLGALSTFPAAPGDKEPSLAFCLPCAPSPEEQSNLCPCILSSPKNSSWHGRAGRTGRVLLPVLQHVALENKVIRIKLSAINCRY